MTLVLLMASCSGDDGPATGPTAAPPTTPTTAVATTSAVPAATAGPSATAVDTTTGSSAAPTTTVMSAPPTTAAVAGYEATIRRTTDGVAHITGASMGDVTFGQGYANGEDHACTVADQILKVKGQRARWFGPGEGDANINSDLAWRAIGIDRRARNDYETASPEVVEAFDGFAAGWSAHLEEVGPGGVSGWCAGKKWLRPISGEDVYAYARSIALLASSGALTDFIATAAPPTAAARDEETPPSTNGFAGALASTDVAARSTGSNAWAVGAEKVTGGEGGLLVGNPHFPWEGERRFWEVHLTVPGETNIYGAQLIGVPGVGIGFTDSFAWSHTVSAGHRFTAYTLDLDPADPRRYLVDGEPREMTAQSVRVQVRRPNGELRAVRRNMWSSEYGPIINFPGVGWTDTQTLTFRDANIGNDEFAEQYLAMTTATSFDEFVGAHREHQGVPLFNTVAVSSDGRAWYADTSATPNLSRQGERLYRRALRDDAFTQVAADNGAILLDGSDSRFEWEEVDGARDPGLVPFDEMPVVERNDYVLNANDSFWMPHATEMLEGNYSILHGEQRTERSLRTRENAFVLSESGEGTPAGDDGTFTGEELRDASVFNNASSARLLVQAVVERCPTAPVDVPELAAGSDGTPGLPAATIDVVEACAVLEAWDGRYELESRGAVLWREMLSAVRRDAPEGLDSLWARAFDPDRPLETPSGLAKGFAVDPYLARAVQTMQQAGLAIDVPLGDVQYALRSRPRIGLHGGPGGDGLTNVIGYSDPSMTSEPMPDPGARIVSGSDLRDGGYPVDNGTSWLMTVDLTGDEPAAWVMLTYGETGDRSSPLFDVQTQRFSDKNWREAAFTEAAIAADPDLTEQTVTGTR